MVVQKFHFYEPAQTGPQISPMPQAMKILDAKTAVDKEWKKLETIPAWQLEQVKSKKEVYSRSTKRQKESTPCFIDGNLSPQKKRS